MTRWSALENAVRLHEQALQDYLNIRRSYAAVRHAEEVLCKARTALRKARWMKELYATTMEKLYATSDKGLVGTFAVLTHRIYDDEQIREQRDLVEAEILRRMEAGR